MARYLVVFDRDSSSMLEMRQFDDVKSALSARLKAEAHYVDRHSVEVVVLSAKSEEALRKTHLRYFESYRDIARNALRRWISTAT